MEPQVSDDQPKAHEDAVGARPRDVFFTCLIAGVLLVVLMGVLLAAVFKEPGGWVVVMVVQMPIGAILGTASWLMWLLLRRLGHGRRGVWVRSALTGVTFAALSFLYWLTAPPGEPAVVRGAAILTIMISLVGSLLHLAFRRTSHTAIASRNTQ